MEEYDCQGRTLKHTDQDDLLPFTGTARCRTFEACRECNLHVIVDKRSERMVDGDPTDHSFNCHVSRTLAVRSPRQRNPKSRAPSGLT